MGTIAVALAEHAVGRDEVRARYPAPSGLVSRILGVLPHAVSYFEVWPPALVTYNLTVPALMDVPKCDLGLGIGADLRAIVAHTASRSFGCQYCTAHTSIMGTVVSGPARTPQLHGRLATASNPDGDAIAAAIRYADAVGRMPSRLSPEVMAELRMAFSADEVEGIVLVATAMGFLNRSMDTLGTPLEAPVQDMVSNALAEHAGWTVGKHDPSLAGLPDPDRAMGRPAPFGFLREVPGALSYEKAALSEVPAKRPQQRRLLEDTLGFTPYWLDVVQRGSARRLFVHWMVERLATPGHDDQVDPALKHTMGFIQARAAGNAPLAAHFAFLARRAGATVEELASAQRPGADPSVSPRDAAIGFAHAKSAGSVALDAALIEGLDRHHTPASVIELLMTVSIVTAMHRFTISMPPVELEPPVADFVSENREQLSLTAMG